jgi:membrane associated rhomboid family serine protease
MPPLPPITQALLLINVALFCIDQQVLGGALSHWLGLWPLQSPNFMPWQLVTYGFMHGSLQHLFFNMLGLWMFGSELERVWGAKRYCQFILASILTAALCQLLMAYLNDWTSETVGISGAIFGLLLAFGMMFPNRIIMPLFPPIPMKAKYFVAIFGGLELVLGFYSTNSSIAHFAHLGGMLGGWLMIRFWRGQPPFPPKKRRGPPVDRRIH